ncbi:hypothetical protein RFZ01_05725, partial [Acinetobacter pittii]|uniref:hypothetical protein n=1 Tax=Acinetobacter pittii TaxID=48296 RepID=UPI002813AE83
MAQRILLGAGYDNVRNLLGGSKTYYAATTPVASLKRPIHSSSNGANSQLDETLAAKDVLKVNACGL